MSTTEQEWIEENKRGLLADIAQVKTHLEGGPGGETQTAEPGARSSALDQMCATFGLTGFERQVLVLAAGVELDSAVAGCCAQAHRDANKPYPTFSLALATLPEAHWSALSPAAPLRRWRLIEVSGPSLTQGAIRIDERVLHQLAGVGYLDERLAGVAELVARDTEPDPLVPSHETLCDSVTAAWSTSRPPGSPFPVVQLCGPDRTGQRAIAAEAARRMGLSLIRVRADALPSDTRERDAMLRLLEREVGLGGAAVLLDCHDLDVAERWRETAVAHALSLLAFGLMVSTRDRRDTHGRLSVAFDVSKPSASEQLEVWRSLMMLRDMNGCADALVAQFDLGIAGIRDAFAQATAVSSARGEDRLSSALWDACRVRSRHGLDELAQRIAVHGGWDQLILPESQLATLKELSRQVHQRAKVYESWGFGLPGSRGLGITALFTGGSGTGKTLAAEVLAHELNLDLYRIDLSQVVSKYIGETEKNLRRVFDAADDGGAVLLFDEADALFGKRSEVKDSHDRYANIEVGYLLQRMEAYRGLAILTTNLKDSLDPAFLRRIRFAVQFPFPDAQSRERIWRTTFPPDAPTEGIELEALGRLQVTGGNIRNIALNAAFIAAGLNEPIRMGHLLHAARSEYAKAERTLTESEVAGWV